MERGDIRLVLLPEDIVAMETLVAEESDLEINDTGEGLLEGLTARRGIEREKVTRFPRYTTVLLSRRTTLAAYS